MAGGQHNNALSKDTLVGGCRIERVLGAGGFGITYLASDLDLDRKVAVKEFLPTSLAMRAADGSSVRPLSSDDESDLKYGLARFRDEAQTLARFSHPNIVGVYKYFEDNDTAYLAMPFEKGESLYDILRGHKTLTQDELNEILPPLLDGLQKVHAAGFLHRDIKPGNIYIREADGSPVLLDFGAARQALSVKSMSLTSIFTPGYAPFEQYSSKGNQGPWTDIYALAATVYRAITGEKPPDASDRMQGDDFKPAAEVAAEAYNKTFLSAIDAGLAMLPGDRPQSIAEWAAMFDGAPGEGTVSRVAAVPKSATRSEAAGGGVQRRSRLRYGIAAAIVVVLSVGGVFGYREYDALQVEKAQLAAARLQAEEAKRKSQEVRAKAAAEREAAADVRRHAAEAATKKQAEAARKKKFEQALAKARREGEAEARRKAAEAARKAAAEKARREAAAQARRKAEEAARKAAAEKARLEAAAEAKRKAAADAEAKRKAATEAARRKAIQEKRRKAVAEARRKAAAEAKKKVQQARLTGTVRIRSILTGRTARHNGPSRSGRGRVDVVLRFTSNMVKLDCWVTTGRGERRNCSRPDGTRPDGTFPWTVTGPNRVCIHRPGRRPWCLRVFGGAGAHRLSYVRRGKVRVFVIS